MILKLIRKHHDIGRLYWLACLCTLCLLWQNYHRSASQLGNEPDLHGWNGRRIYCDVLLQMYPGRKPLYLLFGVWHVKFHVLLLRVAPTLLS